MKIIVLDGGVLNPGDLAWHALEQLGDVTVYDSCNTEQVAERLAGADIAITNKVVLDDTLFSQCPALKMIAVTATGYNVVDIAAARARGIVVSNVPTYGTATVAQFTTALMLELCNRVGEHDADVHAGGWTQRNTWCYWLKPMIEVAGKRVGIIGYGRIGQAFGAVAQALGMEVLACSARSRSDEVRGDVRFVDLDTLYAEADVISLHCPLTSETKGMINSAALQKMKPTALLLNASRGELVNEADLAAALNEGRIAGAAVDVLSKEPAQADNPLLSAKNCLITPHMAWASVEARGRILSTTIDNVKAFLDGQPQNRVDQ
ncbi:D-2-hydroxyacid dehydrogenase [Kosakonia sp. BK9b]|uniref:D-2-hydroxyacid dehydrogenase n=1 Tax=Kosakonia sp. TaxID=1916651 RepID=UPI00289D2955|nr:D-2-hydroxyacid dehydrogenase [Kosakonia sp.]